ncbi:NAD(P)H-hydrate dehydratase [Roseitranquillus sediminis]|uniref:NAD(P)H-hydrate dehydratase n=1 Tax=Roseitranquillus sediminis TaxID=2809051 RepID=UPI001D0C2BD3|nr:NAD(P)H-hydrate dehydratase [Roseitranquillus sediminis]MBM9595228.1 NAD(P)H-hydrate dehydratase [Roseitranquillus sediminis]
MTKRLLTSAEMSALERSEMQAGRVSGCALMERAGSGVADAIETARRGRRRAVVLCGPGNNGGDGFVVARTLARRGWSVDLFLWGDAERLPPDAAANRAAWEAIGPVRPFGDLASGLPATDVVVDAIFGAGQTRPPPPDVAEVTGQLAARTIVAVDIPTGLCMDSGRVLSADRGALRADLTVTFHAPRLGHFLADGPEHCGQIACVDIGLPRGAAGVPLVERPLVDLAKHVGGHKYDSGHALLLSGGPGKGGAIRLAARAALRAGAGLVTIGCPPAALQESAAQLDAIMLRPVRDADVLTEILQDARFSALCLGPGLGVGEGTRALVITALQARRPTVLDADALTAFAEDLTTFRDALHEDCLLTPHMGEFARVFPEASERLNAPVERGPAFSRLDAAREAARVAGCHVLLKGPDTVVAAPDGRAAIHAAQYERAAPWLATAGTGDVLAGLTTGLLARGLPTLEAAATACWLHTECARQVGPGLISEDIADTLPAIYRRLGL